MSQRLVPQNDLTVEIYDSGMTLLNDPDLDAKLVDIDGFRKQYPGGVHADGSFFVPRPVLRYWLVRGAQRVVFRNGYTVAYEGYIQDLTYASSESMEGVGVSLAGATEDILSNWVIRKPWCDMRLDEEAWVWEEFTTGADKFTYDRNNRLMIVPRNAAMAVSDRGRFKYTAPTGQTVKRVVVSWELQEGAQNWTIGLADSGFLSLTSRSTSGTDAIDHTLATPSASVFLYMTSGAIQTPPDDATIFAKFHTIKVYTETGSINMQEVAKDLRAFVTDLSSDEQYIAAAGSARELAPFIVSDFTRVTDVLAEVAGYGDGASPPNRWAWGTYDSEKATTVDGKPALFLELYPTTDDYDYIVKVGADNLATPISMTRVMSSVQNWIPVKYRDSTGKVKWVSPDDDSTLRDDTSITNYRRRASDGLDPGNFDLTNATAYGVRFKNTYKDPVWQPAQPITVREYILDKQGVEVPASLIEPGKRVKVEGWPEDESSNGITFVITGIDYRHRDRTAALTTGGLMTPFLARSLQIAPVYVPEPPPSLVEGGGASSPSSTSSGGGGGGGGGGGRDLNWYKRKEIKAWAKRHGVKLSGPGQFNWKQKRKISREARHERG